MRNTGSLSLKPFRCIFSWHSVGVQNNTAVYIGTQVDICKGQTKARHAGGQNGTWQIKGGADREHIRYIPCRTHVLCRQILSEHNILTPSASYLFTFFILRFSTFLCSNKMLVISKIDDKFVDNTAIYKYCTPGKCIACIACITFFQQHDTNGRTSHPHNYMPWSGCHCQWRHPATPTSSLPSQPPFGVHPAPTDCSSVPRLGVPAEHEGWVTL